MKRVSVLKEIRPGERRVILTPAAIEPFVDRGFDVLVESAAGAASGYPDSDYTAAGARVVDLEEAWHGSNYVLKYKAPSPEEYRFFRPRLHLGAFLHAEGNPTLTEAMRVSGMTAIAYEFHQQLPDGRFPLAVSDNEVAGHLAVLYGAYHLQAHEGGSGIFLWSVPGAPRARVVVIGHGNVGGAAARSAASLGAEVIVFGTDAVRLRQFAATVPPGVRCSLNTPDKLRAAVRNADLVIGAILVSDPDTPPMIDDATVRSMRHGSMIVDVTCGYGPGYLPTFHRLTTHDAPVYSVHGVLHCKIDALPAAVPLTATSATSSNIAPFLLELGEKVYTPAGSALTVQDGLVVADHQIAHPEVRRVLELVDSRG